MTRPQTHRLGDLQLKIMKLLREHDEAAAEEISRGMSDHLVDRLFAGSLTEVVSHLLTTREVSRAELRELEKLIAERRKVP